MTFKLKNYSDKLQGKFTRNKIYVLKHYYSTYCTVEDDCGKTLIIDINTKNFQNHFKHINQERKEKIEEIENGLHIKYNRS